MTSTKSRGNAFSNLRFLAPALRLWPIILVATLAGGAATWGLSQASTPVYSATSTLYFSLSNGSSGNDLNQGATYTQQQMLSYAQLAESELVLTAVVDELGLPVTPAQLANSITVGTPQNTVVLDITASSASPERASDIANEVGASLKDVVAEVAPTAVDGAPTVRIRTVERAAVPTFASAPNTRVNTIAGLVLGFVASTLLVLLFVRLDTRLRRAADIEEVTTLPVLGAFHRDDSAAHGRVSQAEPRTAEAETYRQVRAEIENAVPLRRAPILLIASSLPHEGTSTVARNLAEAFGRDGESLPPVPAGQFVRPRAGSSELATIVDGGAVHQTADAAAVARDVDGIVLVVDRRQAHAHHLRHTIEVLERSGGTILGIVMTSTPAHPRAHADTAGHTTASRTETTDDEVAENDDAQADSSAVATR
jgi:capsular polysaccharide biosynthesis protein